MHLKLLVSGSKLFYKEPAMVIVTPTNSSFRFTIAAVKEHSDYELLEQFVNDNISKAIVIDGLEEGEVMLDARAFIFTARKHFDPGTRPLIMIYTKKYTLDELRHKSFTGLESEMLQYGNCILVCKKIAATGQSQNKMFEKIGIKSFAKTMELHGYFGRQYE